MIARLLKKISLAIAAFLKWYSDIEYGDLDDER